MLRALTLKRLAKLRSANLVIEDALGVTTLGVTTVGGTTPGEGRRAVVHVCITDPRTYEAIALRGSVGAAEAYIEGGWHCDDLVGLVRVLVANRASLDGMERGVSRIGTLILALAAAFRRNTRAGSRRNVAAHYDLGNEFFRLWLSPDLMYSSAYWAGPDDTLERASSRKLERICALLQLSPDDHVLEIGSGWGGFALHAARHHGCRVTTTTISAEQYRLARERAARAGLEDRITVLRQDYRELTGEYDKLVSIEMVEAIGARYLPEYFRRIAARLKPDGLAVLQAITIEDHRYRQALRSADFIKRYVFPGSFIPSIEAILRAKSQASDLGLLYQEDFGLSYARTLEAWRKSFLAKRDAVRALGFDDRFIRLWEYYLAYCEGGFRERAIGVSHLLFARPGHRPPEAQRT